MLGSKLPKQHKLGIHQTLLNTLLKILELTLLTSYSPKSSKPNFLEKARILTEIAKHLLRTEYELEIISERTYLRIAKLLVETSKMFSGWIKYLQKQNLPTKK